MKLYSLATEEPSAPKHAEVSSGITGRGCLKPWVTSGGCRFPLGYSFAGQLEHQPEDGIHCLAGFRRLKDCDGVVITKGT